MDLEEELLPDSRLLLVSEERKRWRSEGGVKVEVKRWVWDVKE